MLNVVNTNPDSTVLFEWYFSLISGFITIGRLDARMFSYCSFGTVMYWISLFLVNEFQRAAFSETKLISRRSMKGGDRP